jgi:hypothetical protein
LASVSSVSKGAQGTVGQVFIIRVDFALLVVDNRQGSVPEDMGILASIRSVSPSHGGHRLVVTVETFGHQANGRNFVRVCHGHVQRQDGQVVFLLKN